MPLDGGEGRDLWEHVLETAPVGHRKIEVPARGGPNRRKGRVAKLTLRYVEVDLLPPKDRADDPPVRAVAVSVCEENAPRRQTKPLHWMLLFNGGVADLETAREVLRWYELRWRIERFFHALKQGIRIEDRRLDEADDLRKCLAFDAVTAFRVWDLTHLARKRPDDPATLHVTVDTIETLRALAARDGFNVARGPPNTMTIARFVVLTAGPAGFHPSKRQPLPGTAKLWEGVRFLYQGVKTIQAMKGWEENKTEEENRDLSVLD